MRRYLAVAGEPHTKGHTGIRGCLRIVFLLVIVRSASASVDN